MTTLLSSFLSQVRSNALWLTLVGIVTIELLAHPYLFNNFFSHEVDKLLHTLKTKKFNAQIVTIGDSVGHGIFSGWDFARGKIVNLACNQATETAGQYFFLKRYLENNRMPRAVISCDRTPLEGNLQQNLTENYIQRCFTYWSEIAEIALIKLDPAFTSKMIAYKFLSTYTYRLHLQQKILGVANSNIYSGISQSGSASTLPTGLFSLIQRFLGHSREESISEIFFNKIIQMLQKENVSLYYFPPPSRIDNGDTDALIRQTMTKLEKLKDASKNILLLNEHYQRLPKEYFGDDVHLNTFGLVAFRPSLHTPLADLSSAVLSAHQKEFLRRFSLSASLLNSTQQNNQVPQPTSLHDAFLSNESSILKITATGIDPAMVLPPIETFSPNKNERAIAFFKLESEVATIAKLYYSFSSKLAFSEIYSQSKKVSPGINRLFFILPKEFAGGMLRFDPGEAEGKYSLHQLEVKLVQADHSYQHIDDLFQVNSR